MPDLDAQTERSGGGRWHRTPERRCIVTRQQLGAEAMIRFVSGPDGVVVPDLKARLPGRGAWVTASAAIIRQAARKGHFARALKSAVKAPEDLDQAVGALLLAQALNALGMAGGQGAVETGFSKVDAGVRSRRYGVVLFAGDGAEDSRRKLLAGLRAGGREHLGLFTGFSCDQMSLALGRANVIHAGIVAGRVAAAVTETLRRLDDYRGGGALKSPVA